MMVLVAKHNKGIIREGMRFVLLRETSTHLECWSKDLELTFKITKENIHNNFDFIYY